MNEPDLHWVKMINAGERVVVNRCAFGYLSQRIVFYLLNLHIKSRQTYFARAGTSNDDEAYKADASLSEEGHEYAKKMGEALTKHRENERQTIIDLGGKDDALKPLTVWTSTRRWTVETAEYLADLGYRVRQRSQLSQLNPGDCEKLSEQEIMEKFPAEVTKHIQDPYHHRYPRAEVWNMFDFCKDFELMFSSLIMTLRCVWNRLFSSSKGSRMTFSSLRMKAFYEFSMAISWHVMLPISLSLHFQGMKS